MSGGSRWYVTLGTWSLADELSGHNLEVVHQTCVELFHVAQSTVRLKFLKKSCRCGHRSREGRHVGVVLSHGKFGATLVFHDISMPVRCDTVVGSGCCALSVIVNNSTEFTQSEIVPAWALLPTGERLILHRLFTFELVTL